MKDIKTKTKTNRLETDESVPNFERDNVKQIDQKDKQNDQNNNLNFVSVQNSEQNKKSKEEIKQEEKEKKLIKSGWKKFIKPKININEEGINLNTFQKPNDGPYKFIPIQFK